MSNLRLFPDHLSKRFILLYARISSGLDFLDASIGGLYSNRCYMLRGPAQSGRTTMSLQYLLAGLENGENGLMISSDRIENVILKAEAMGISLENYLMDNRLILMEYPQEITRGQFHFGGIVNLLGEIEHYVKMYNCSRLVVDTLLPLLIQPNEPHFVNYVYSLMNSFDAMNVTTLVTTGEPSSPTALRIIQLLEDAVVGSFALSKTKTAQGEQRGFTQYKLVNPVNPPTSFKVRIEYGVGVTQDIPTYSSAQQALPPGTSKKTTIKNLPLELILIDKDEDTQSHLEEIFGKGTKVLTFSSEQDFALQLYNLDCDMLLLSADQQGVNWRQVLTLLRDAYPKLPMFLILNQRSSQLNYKVAKQIGADGLFVKPLEPNDLIKAFEKTLKHYGTYDDLIEKRGGSTYSQDLPEDFADPSQAVPGVAFGMNAEANLISVSEFKERLTMQVWRGNQEQKGLSLVSFKTVYVGQTANIPNMPQGLELIKRVAMNVTDSLRGINDFACRYMDKIVVLLEDGSKEGAQAFARRVTNELQIDLSEQLNLQLNKHFHILTAVAIYPDDANNVNDLMSHVTDVSKNFVKSIS